MDISMGDCVSNSWKAEYHSNTTTFRLIQFPILPPVYRKEDAIRISAARYVLDRNYQRRPTD